MVLDHRDEFDAYTQDVWDYFKKSGDWRTQIKSVPGGFDEDGRMRQPMTFDMYMTWFSSTFGEAGMSVMNSGSSSVGLDPSERAGVKVFTNVHEGRKHLVSSTEDRSSTLQNGMLRIAAPGEADPPSEMDVVLFEDVEVSETEGDKFTEIGLVRRGVGDCDVHVEWSTENLNMSEATYQDQAGTAVIKAGQFRGAIHIKIYDDDAWSLESKLYVKIDSVTSKGARMANVGDLARTTLVVLNDDSFPQGVDPEELDEDGALKNTGMSVVKAFAQHMYNDLHSEANAGMIFKIYPSLHWLMTQVMMFVALNIAMKQHSNDPETYRRIVYILAACFLVSLFLWMHASWAFIELRLGGKCRMILKKAISGTMLQLTKEAQVDFPPGEILGIASESVNEIFSRCWGGLFNIWDQIVTLVVLFAWTGYVVRETPYLMAIPVVQMICDYMVYFCRSEEQVHKAMVAIEADDEWKTTLVDISDARELVTMFRASPLVLPKIQEVIATANKTLWQSDRYQTDTAKILRAVHSLFIVACFCTGLELFLNNPASFGAGNFVALMGTIFKFDGVVRSLFASLDNLNVGYAFIRRIASLLNAPTKRKATLAHRRAMQEKSGHSNFINPEDITVSKAAYELPTIGGINHMVGPFNFSIEQGQLACIKAQGSGKGKKTLLQLIAKLFIPIQGEVLYPGNLRVRYVPAVPIIWKGDLMYNLRFGNMNKGKSQIYSDAEVWAVWRLFGGNPKYADAAAKAKQGGDAEEIDVRALSLADNITLGLVRAMLSSSDLLLLGSTLDGLGEQASTRNMLELREWVRNRGLKCLTTGAAGNVAVSMKKKKTLIFSTRMVHLQNEADSVIEID